MVGRVDHRGSALISPRLVSRTLRKERTDDVEQGGKVTRMIEHEAALAKSKAGFGRPA